MSQNWELNELLHNCMVDRSAIRKQADEIYIKLKQLETKIAEGVEFEQALNDFQALSMEVREGTTLCLCLVSDNTSDSSALSLQSQFDKCSALHGTIEDRLSLTLSEMDDETFQKLLEKEAIHPIRFSIEELRRLRRKKLPTKEEAIISNLSLAGFSPYEQIYYSYLGELEFPLGDQKVSFAELENAASDPDRKVREEAFLSLESTLSSKSTIFSQLLNGISGFRLSVYQERGWTNSLSEALQMNRVDEISLRSMLEAIQEIKPKLTEYLAKKAERLGLEQLAWYDLDAPLGTQATFTYEKGCEFILDQFSNYSPSLAAFAKRAIEKRWIESESRPKKRGGGFCTDAPIVKQSRIFMNWQNTMTNVMTLAHELGHAYHSDIIFDLPELCQHYPMNLAETASTMAELIVSNGALEATDDENEKLFLLTEKIDRSVAFCMDIPARFYFEENLYLQRKLNPLDAETLSSMMIEAQKKAFNMALSTYHPLFWCSKMHFYFTDIAFYNFPYAMGYLFSLGIFSKIQDQFEEKFAAILEDTGRMSTEALLKKHLDVDLHKPDFWQNACSLIVKDIDAYLACEVPLRTSS